MTEQPSGTVTIAPQVLTTIVEQTALDTAGVLALGPHPPRIKDVEGHRAVGASAEAIVNGNTVTVAISIKASPNVNTLELAETLQRDITLNIKHILDMQATRVNVLIGDVTFLDTPQETS